MNNNTKKITFLAIGIALYTVLGMSVKVPLIGHIQTDLGYVAFGAFLYLMGLPAVIVGVIGCILESLIVSGWFPVGWSVGQLFIGIACGIAYKKYKSNAIQIAVTFISVFIGIGLIKTAIECAAFGIPWSVKFTKDMIAFVADVIPMYLGLILGHYLKPTYEKSFNE